MATTTKWTGRNFMLGLLGDHAEADDFSFTESDLLESGVLQGNIVTLDVLLNDDAGARIHSLTSLQRKDTATGANLIEADAQDVWEALLDGTGSVVGAMRIMNGRVELDLSASLQRYGVSSVGELQAGQVIQIQFAYAVALAGSEKPLDWTTVQFTLTGESNQSATISGYTPPAVVVEDEPATFASGQLTVSDPDSGEATFQHPPPAALTGQYGSFTFAPGASSATWHWTYTLDDRAQALAQDQQVSESLTVFSFDGTASQVITVVVRGSNDAPVATFTAGQAATEDGSVLSGQLTSTDTDAGATATYALVGDPIPGLTLDTDGSWTFDPRHAAYQHLAQDATLPVVVTYSVTDPQPASGQGSFTITVTGTNDAPVVASTEPVLLSADGVPISFDALANASDVDAGAALSVTGVQPLPVGVIYDAMLAQFIVLPSTEAFRPLAAGASTTVTVNYGVSDGTATTAASLSWVITGINDAPVAVADSASSTHHLALTIDVLANDTDVDENHAFTLVAASAPAGKGSASVVDNQLVFKPGTDFNHLKPGDTEEVILGYSMQDEHGASSSSTVALLLTGNTPALIHGDIGVGMQEDGRISIAGLDLSVSDPDAGQARFQSPGVLQGTYGAFSFDPETGTWGYEVDNGSAQVQALRGAWFDGENWHAPQIVADELTVTSWDGTATRTISAEIVGANDMAGITGTSSGAVQEDGNGSASGQLSVADVDTGEARFKVPASLAGTYGEFSFDAETGAWTYTLDAARAQSLPGDAGAPPAVDTLEVFSFDGTASRTITVSIAGANDAPVMARRTEPAPALEDGAPVAVDALAGVTDVDQGATLSVGRMDSPLPRGVTYDGANHRFTLDPSDAAYQSLAAGETLKVTVNYEVTDGTASVPASASWIVTGTNDAPVVTSSSPPSGSVMEDVQLTATGTVTSFDVDHGATATYSGDATGTYGSFTVDPETGAWTYTLDNAAHQDLAAGESHSETFTVTVSDGRGGSASQDVTLTVTGTNDTPRAAEITTDATEDGEAVVIAPLSNAFDIDHGATLSVDRVQPMLPPGVSYDATTQRFTLDPSDAAYQALAAGETTTVTVRYQVTDGTAGTATSATWTLSGTNDVPVIGGVSTGAVTEDASSPDLSTGGALTIVDPDAAQSGFIAQAGAVGSNGYGSFTLDAAGNWTYTASNALPAIQQLGAGQSLTDSFTAVSSDESNAQLVTVTIHGTDDIPDERHAATVIEDSQQTATGTVRFREEDLADGHVVTSILRMSTHELPLGSFTAGPDPTGTAGLVTWTYTLDDDAAQFLAHGQVVTEVHRITISDSTGGTATQDVTITITGTNDAPRVTPVIRPVHEDQGVQVLDALAGSTDREWGTALQVVGVPSELPEGVSYDPISHSFKLDLSLPLYQALADGETRVVTVSYGVSDGMETVPGSATWTLMGTNDRPLVWGTNHARVSTSSGPAVAGQLFIQDADQGQSSWQLVKPQGLYGTLSFDEATGQWQYAPDAAAWSALPPGFQDNDVFHLRSADGSLIPIFIQISLPTADSTPQPWSEGNTVGRVIEDTPTGMDELGNPVTRISGVLLDPTGGAAGTLRLADGASLTGPYGTFSFEVDPATHVARWSFTLDNASIEVQRLAGGGRDFGVQDLALSFADGTPAPSIRVEIAGTNDRALVLPAEGELVGTLVLGSGLEVLTGPTRLFGQLYVRDIDNGQGGFDRLPVDEDGFFRVDGDYGTFLFDFETGAWHYELDHDPFPLWQLGAGEIGTDTLTVWSADRSASATITARIEGQDDPTLFFGGVSGPAIEDQSIKVSGQAQAGDLDTGTRYLVTLMAGDRDAGWDEALQGYVHAGLYGTLVFRPNGGAIQYLLANDADAVQALRGSERVHDFFYLRTSDGTVQEIAISITGANDAAVVVGTTPATVVTTDPGTHATGGALTVTDRDMGEDRFNPVDDLRGQYGQFGFDAATGAWTYTLDLSRVPARSADDPALQDTLTVTTADGTTAQVTVDITGSREARTISGTATGALIEDGPASFVEDALRLDDPPTGHPPFQAPDRLELGTDHGSFSFDAMTGQWRFDLDHVAEAVQSLGAGDTVTETLTVHSWDGSASQLITVTITGTNDAAFISGHTTGQVQHPDQVGGLPFTSGLLTVQDRDAGESLLDSDGVFQGRYGTLTVDADTGHWLYSLAGTLAFQALAPGETSNDVFTLYSVDQTPVQVTITATGFNEPAVITGATTTVVSGTSGLPATGSVFIDDPDPGQSAFKPLDAPQGQYGYLTFTPETGDWSYAVDPARLPAAGEDLIVRDAFQVHSLDGQSSDFIRFEIQVPAGFVPPVAVEIDAQLNASSPWQVLRGSIEHAAHFTLPASVDGLYGQFSFDADRGTWAYALDAGLSSELALEDRLSLTAANGSTVDLAISIPGRHAGTLITGRDSFHITELTTEATTPEFLRARGNLLALDLRTGAQVAFVESTAGPEGGFSIDAQGNWTYEIATVDAVRGQVQFAAQTLTGEVHLVTVTLDEMTLDALGTDGHEALIGDPARAETVLAGAGSDYVVGLYTASSGLRGEAGNDLLAAGARVDESGTWAGDNVLDGGDGDDALFGVASGLQAFGTTILLGGAGKDTLVGGEGLTVGSGGVGDDVLIAGAGAATLFGGEGHDLLVAGTGGGRLVGGDGDDTLYTTLALAGSPMALLYGGSGQNRFVLGDGPDRVIFDAPGSSNRIENFNAAANGDLLGLSSAAFPDLSGPLDATWWQEVSSWQEIVLPTEQDHARFVLVDSGAETVELVLAQSSGLQLLAEFSNLSGTLGYEDIVWGAPPASLPPTAF